VLKTGTIRDMHQKVLGYEEFVEKLKSLNKEGLDVYIGTDSQVLGQKPQL